MPITIVAIEPKAKSMTIRTDFLADTLVWRYWPETEAVTLELTEDQAALLVDTGLVLTPALVGGGEGDSFRDGVYQLQLFSSDQTEDIKVLVNKALECCLSAEIGKLAETDPDCQDTETDRNLQRLIRWRFAADVKMDLKDYDGAHNLTIAGLATCKGGCGCE